MSVWFLSQSLMQKDPGQAGESVVTLQRSGPAEPGQGGVSSGGIGGCGGRGGGVRVGWVLHSAAHVGLRRRRWWGGGAEVKRGSSN